MKRTLFQTLKKFDLINILIFLVIVFLIYFLSLKFVFPGYFDPLIPHHADYYKGFSGSPIEGFLAIYKTPRPVGYFFGNCLLLLGLNLGIVLLIAITLVSILLTIFCVKQITGKISYLIAIIYLLNIFTSSSFYFYYTYDGLDILAYFFFIFIIILWYKYKNSFNFRKISLISLFVFLCFFSKETYFIAVVLFFTFQFIFEKSLRKYSFPLIIVSLIFIFISVTHSHFTNSEWVNLTATSDNPYFVSFNPKDIVATYLFYIEGIGNIYNIVIIALSVLIMVFAKKHLKEAIMFLLLGLSVYIPYSIQPNHKLGYYVWLGVPLAYAVILFLNADIFNRFKAKIFNKFRFNKKHAFLLIVLILASLTIVKIDFNKNNEYPSAWWVLEQETINRNILNSFERVKQELSSISAEDRNVLILGLKYPFHPFVHSQFIDNYFKNEHANWTIAIYNEDATLTNDDQTLIFETEYGPIKAKSWDEAKAKIRKRDNHYQYIDINEINPKYYNIVIIYNQNGELEKVTYNK